MSLQLNTYDISSFKQKGKELFDEIVKHIKPLAESNLMVTMPDSIRMTQDQYDDLMKLSGLENSFFDEHKLFQTPYNIMEVRVNERKKLTFTEAMSLDDKNFNEWEKQNESNNII